MFDCTTCYIYFGIVLRNLIVVLCQEELEAPEEEGVDLVFILLYFFFGFNFLVPPLRFIYEKLLKGLLIKAGNKIMEIQAQLNERLSDASRKLSDRMTTV